MRPQEDEGMKTIRSLLGARETITVARTAPVVEAARLMSSRHIGALPVLDADRLVGIFTERDVVRRVVALARDPQTTQVGEVMSTDLVVAEIGEDCEVCLSRMQQAHVRHLIALSNGRLAGVVSVRDVLKADLDEKEYELTMLNAYVHYIPADIRATTARP
jgi:CBS domain-containing protein